MKELIDVFRMVEIDPKVRASIIIKLGKAVNDEHCSNITESIVYELVKQLDDTNKILSDEHYLKHITL